MIEGYVTTAEIAEMADAKPGTVRQWASRHEEFPKATALGPRLNVYKRSEVKAWLKAHRPKKKEKKEVAK